MPSPPSDSIRIGVHSRFPLVGGVRVSAGTDRDEPTQFATSLIPRCSWWSLQETLLRAQATRSQVQKSASQRAHREHAPNRLCGESPLAKLQRVSSEDRKTPVCGQAVKQSAEMRSALEFFATAHSCRELSVCVDSVVAGSVARVGAACCAEKLEGNRGPQERCLLIADRARLTVVKLRLLATPSLARRIEETKNSSCVELECGTTPLVRDDSARSHVMCAQLG